MKEYAPFNTDTPFPRPARLTWHGSLREASPGYHGEDCKLLSHLVEILLLLPPRCQLLAFPFSHQTSPWGPDTGNLEQKVADVRPALAISMFSEGRSDNPT